MLLNEADSLESGADWWIGLYRSNVTGKIKRQPCEYANASSECRHSSSIVVNYRITCSVTTDEWLWLDDTPVDVTMWAPSEPVSELERSYVAMQTDTFAGSWKTLTDSSSNNVICKMAKGEKKKNAYVRTCMLRCPHNQ